MHYWVQPRDQYWAVGISLGVAAILGAVALWAMSRPNHIVGFLNANESAAIATLKNIHLAQEKAAATGRFDMDGDDTGGFGFFLELAARAPGPGGDMLPEPLLHPAFCEIRDFGDGRGCGVTRSGYRFQMHLARTDGSWATEHAQGDRPALPDGIRWREDTFACYAWPQGFDDGGKRAFLITEAGQVLACRNATTRYGADLTPSPRRAGFAGPDALAANRTALDGERWIVVQ